MVGAVRSFNAHLLWRDRGHALHNPLAIDVRVRRVEERAVTAASLGLQAQVFYILNEGFHEGKSILI